ncbi:hypothetical protein Patl1_00470 [Pistacia atlantica]|uniref:Uncharacterized protein n=1 Tax=Pistacia atlantica TaxID=434234 RepID=A0ACC1C5A1_9ROSI|nr:hypothetical protein Patl1_00470 [Pistacia atlantica]
MAFSRTPLISFLLISLLFASTMARLALVVDIFASFHSRPRLLERLRLLSISKTRFAAPAPSKITPWLLLPLAAVATSPPSPLPSISSTAPDFSLVDRLPTVSSSCSRERRHF